MSTFRISPYAPANETLATVMAERLDINGYILGAVGYGVHATLFFLCLSLLLQRLRRDPKSSTSSRIFLAYITLNFILGSVGNGINCLDNQQEFIDNRDFPGGPEAYEKFVAGSFINIFGAAVYIVNTWTQDGLLLYRFCVIFDYNYLAITLPCLSYFGSIAMSCLYLATLSQQTTAFGANLVNFALAYWSISVGTTILLTMSIVGHLLLMRYQINNVLGASRGSPYVSISAMFIESALLYSVVGCIVLVCFAKGFPAQTLVLPLLGQVQSIAPLLIILRVAQGQALERDTFKRTGNATVTSALEFADSERNSYGLSGFNSSVTKNHSDDALYERKLGGVEVTRTTYAKAL
ncbi:hypothetical protein BU17DRAFT_44544 [Hysterangium stoloniferum]|nr:hypothetical protein BU17DRAFT_44544 [Hysterangium stoloniferum]